MALPGLFLKGAMNRTTRALTAEPQAAGRVSAFASFYAFYYYFYSRSSTG